MLKELKPINSYQYLEKKNYNNNKIEILSKIETDQNYNITDISCNCTGSTIAVSQEIKNHHGFCTHSSYIYFLSTLNNSQHKYYLESCATSILYHPHYPGIIAIGHHTGEITLLRSEEKWAFTELGKYHFDKIVSLNWILENQTVKSLVSASFGGIICVWNLKGRNSRTKILEQVKSIIPLENNGSISCMSIIPNTFDALVGFQSGQIIRITLPYDEPTIMKEKQYFNGHTGPISSISINNSFPGLFLTVGTDRLFCIRNNICKDPLIMNEISNKPLYDIQWCPHSSPLCAIVSLDKLIIIDISISPNNLYSSIEIPNIKKITWNPIIKGNLIAGCNNGLVFFLNISYNNSNNKILLDLEEKTNSNFI